MKALLKVVECPTTGELGLKIEGVRMMEGMYAANEGRLIAHDLIEHVNGVEKIGTIHDELEALGGVWFTRGQYSDISRPQLHSAHDDIAADLTNLCRLYIESNVTLKPYISRSCVHSFDDDFDCCIEVAKNYLDSELESYSCNVESVLYFMDQAKMRMRVGARKAQRKYKTAVWANSLFWDIADVVEPWAKHCDYEFDTYELHYGRGIQTRVDIHTDYVNYY